MIRVFSGEEIAEFHKLLFAVEGDDSKKKTTPRKGFMLTRSTTRKGGRVALPEDDDDLLDRIRRSRGAAKFDRLWSGDITGYPSHSEADLALCSILAHWARGDVARVDRLFRRSGLFRAKWDEHRGEQTYGEKTIEHVLAEYPIERDAEDVRADVAKLVEDLAGAKNPAHLLTEPETVRLLKEVRRVNKNEWIRLRDQVRKRKWMSIRDLDDLLGEEGATTEDAGPSSMVDRLIEIGRKDELLCDRSGTTYARVESKGRLETLPIRSGSYQQSLVRRFLDQYGKAPGREAKGTAIETLDAYATEGPELSVGLRVAGNNSTIYLDLVDPDWRVVEVDANGWSLRERAPIPMLRKQGMTALPVPEGGGSIDLLRRILNVGSKEDWILIVAWLVAALRPPTQPY